MLISYHSLSVKMLSVISWLQDKWIVNNQMQLCVHCAGCTSCLSLFLSQEAGISRTHGTKFVGGTDLSGLDCKRAQPLGEKHFSVTCPIKNHKSKYHIHLLETSELVNLRSGNLSHTYCMNQVCLQNCWSWKSYNHIILYNGYCLVTRVMLINSLNCSCVAVCV